LKLFKKYQDGLEILPFNTCIRWYKSTTRLVGFCISKYESGVTIGFWFSIHFEIIRQYRNPNYIKEK
jgi:hypothetical protein